MKCLWTNWPIKMSLTYSIQSSRSRSLNGLFLESLHSWKRIGYFVMINWRMHTKELEKAWRRMELSHPAYNHSWASSGTSRDRDDPTLPVNSTKQRFHVVKNCLYSRLVTLQYILYVCIYNKELNKR